jgi:L-iditol 2-dehydrogenase
LTIACLKIAGAGRIWAVEPLAHRREMAKAMGADVAIDPAEVDAAKEIYGEAGNRGVDCAIDCATKQDTTNAAIRAACNGGRVVITGIHSECLVPFEVSPMRRKELAIFNVRRSNDEPERARDLMVEKMKWFAPMVTHRRGLADIADAFVKADSYADGAVKTVIV